MFVWLSTFILRNRLWLTLLIAGVSVFMLVRARDLQLSYDFARILPASDPDYIAYDAFKKKFGEDGSVMVLGIRDTGFYRLGKFRAWYRLGEDIKAMEGVEAVVSEAHLFTLQRNDSAGTFDVRPLLTAAPTSQTQVDSLKREIERLPFYKGLIRNPETGASLMAITFDKSLLNTRSRIDLVAAIREKAEAYGKDYGVELHLSGLPYIRTAITSKVVDEMEMFMGLELLVTALVLLFFFRSFRVLFFSLIVVGVGVIWSVGTIALLGYKITILSGLIPPLIIVIGIPNSIFLLNKYHAEYSRHGQKEQALSQMVQRIGLTTFLANLTTAIGFLVFYFTHSRLLMEFGLVAAINVMSTWLISLFLIPIVFSYLAPPARKHLQHLHAPEMNRLLLRVEKIVNRHPRKIYGTVLLILLVSGYGITRISTNGYMVDDLPKRDPVYTDMKFFESNFKGVLPLEISIQTLREGGALHQTVLQKINRLQKMLAQYPGLSRPVSVVEGIKFTWQAYNGQDPRYYLLPGTVQLAELADFAGGRKDRGQLFRSFIDSSRRETRVSVQMADIGTVQMRELMRELSPRMDSIFPPAEYNTTVTGNSLMFLKGNQYMLRNLMESIILAIVLISLIMVSMFMSLRMILISILPSVIPLLITAGLMGFLHIPLKPSTILIFSIAFGLASDQTIYFLTRYRHEMLSNPVLSISAAVAVTIRETGISMIYSAIILFFGFMAFSLSGFGGTAAMGQLLSITLLIAMVANLLLLPALLLSLERRLTTRAFLSEPLFESNQEEEDIERGDLQIRKPRQEEE
ncbi:MAG: MMPL family transporter [Bacteroidia bacterium]|nr:MMPL family transporter [Bacteroidia bacterium]